MRVSGLGQEPGDVDFDIDLTSATGIATAAILPFVPTALVPLVVAQTPLVAPAAVAAAQEVIAQERRRAAFRKLIPVVLVGAAAFFLLR